MGGVAAIVNRDGAPVGREDVARMAAAASFRGPDGISIAVRSGLGVAHLAHHTTLESHREGQPLWSPDGIACLAADARIDNRPELISELKLGAEHPQPTDADLILAAYLEWGEACFDRLVGDYAIVVHDDRTHTTVLARDAVGTRPLHYHWGPTRLVAASDALQILSVPGISGDLDGYRMVEFLTNDYRPRHRTMFAAIQSVLPGHAIAFPREGGPRAWRHWRPHLLAPIEHPERREYVRRFRELLERSVADRMRIARGRAAVMLSGGLDSSAVLALCADHSARSDTPSPFAVSMVLADSAYQEVSFARDVSGHHGVELREFELGTVFPLSRILQECLSAEAPWLNPGPAEGSLLNLAEIAQSHGTILFNGFGGDSLFAGEKLARLDLLRTSGWQEFFNWARGALRNQRRPFRGLLRVGFDRFLPLKVIQGIDRFRAGRRPAPSSAWQTDHLIRRLGEIRESEGTGLPVVFSSQTLQFQWSVSMSMGNHGSAIPFWNRVTAEHQMEVRMPLLDRRLTEYILRCPTRLWAVPGPENTKWLLREATKGLLPESVRTRIGKTGCGNYYHDALRQLSVSEEFCGQDLSLATNGLLHPQGFTDALRSVQVSRGNDFSAVLLYPVIQMESWLRRFARNRKTRFVETSAWAWEQEKGVEL